MKRKRPQVKANLGELDRILDQALTAPLPNPDHAKVKTALHVLADFLEHRRNTEKTAAVIPPPEPEPSSAPVAPPKPGHGRNGADAFEGATTISVPHETLERGQKCPECNIGKVYPLKEPAPLVRLTGQAPLAATVYDLERLRRSVYRGGSGSGGAGEV